MSAVTKWQYWFKQGKDCIIFVGSRPGKRGKWLQYRQLPQQIRDYLCLVKSKRNWIADGIPTLTELDPQATNELKNFVVLMKVKTEKFHMLYLLKS